VSFSLIKDEFELYPYQTGSKCGLATTQAAYREAVRDLFKSLDQLEARLSKPEHGKYYFGNVMTEVDVRLYVTMIRFDPVYYNLFKTNTKAIRCDYPAIHQWLRTLYWQIPAYGTTTQFEHIKGHYFQSLTMLNPGGLIPEGPELHIMPLD
jgi:glutathionyl-hydroquinone reductase